jgi:hypothetical protein
VKGRLAPARSAHDGPVFCSRARRHSLLERAKEGAPLYDFASDWRRIIRGVGRRWRVPAKSPHEDPRRARRRPLCIADGHHRYHAEERSVARRRNTPGAHLA